MVKLRDIVNFVTFVCYSSQMIFKRF